MLDYSISARYNPMEKNEPARYYASAQTNNVMNLNQFAKVLWGKCCLLGRSVNTLNWSVLSCLGINGTDNNMPRRTSI